MGRLRRPAAGEPLNRNVLALDLVVPGDPATATGGYLYDRKILEGLERLGWRTSVHALDPSFPQPTGAATAHAREVLASIPDGRVVVVDGLALAGLGDTLHDEARRLALVALIHHPTGDETGLPDGVRAKLIEQERHALGAVRRIVVTSPWTARRLAAIGVRNDLVRVVEPGTDRRERHAAPAREEVVRLLCVATITQRKGHAVLIDALASLRSLRWRLDCIGSLTRELDTVAALRSRIAELGLADRVALLGEQPPSELDRYYAQADAFVLASHLEGYGMALAEALVHGLPIVSTTAGAIPDTVPAYAALLVPPGDAEALAGALRTIVEDRARRRALAARASEAGRKLPQWSDASARFAAAVADLCAERASA